MTAEKLTERERGIRDGIRWAVTWLHIRAEEMNDPHAKAILNTAAFNMGNAAAKTRWGHNHRPRTDIVDLTDAGRQALGRGEG